MLLLYLSKISGRLNNPSLSDKQGKTLSIQPKLYKDLFDWDKFCIFKNYKITNLNSFNSLNKF